MSKSPKNIDAVEAIKGYLLSNGYKAGDRIPTQLELAQLLNMKDRTLRHGIALLVEQGVLVPRGRAGTFIVVPQGEAVIEPIKWLYEVKDISDYDLINARVIMECAILEEVCNNRTTKDLLLMQSIVEKQSCGFLSAKEELQLDKKFHLKLISCTHNKALEIIGNVIMLQLDLLYDRGLYPEHESSRVQEHQNIIDAIYDRNVSKTQELLSEHLTRCYNFANTLPKNPLKIKTSPKIDAFDFK